MNLKIMQYNLGRGRAATNECLREATARGFQILILQEPYVGARGSMSLPTGCRVIQSASGSPGAPVRAAIVILNPGLRYTENINYISEDLLGVIIRAENLDIGIISVYLDKELDLDVYLDRVKRMVQGMGCTRVLVAGDVNAASPWWGCAAEDARGAALAELYAELGLEVCNSGDEPTFLAYRHGAPAASIIDVTACSAALLPALADWRLDPALCTLSDHRPITFTLRLSARRGEDAPAASTRIYNTTKANWTLFEGELEQEISRCELSAAVDALADGGAVNRATDLYTECVLAACERAIPHIQPRRLGKSCRWWRPELTELKAEMVRRRRRIARANPSRRRFVVDRYLEARTEYRKAIESAMTASWKEFCTGETVEGIWQRSYRIMKACGTRARSEDALLVATDGRALDEAQSAALLADTFYRRDDPQQDAPQHAARRVAVSAWADRLAHTALPHVAFTETELETVLRTMSPKRAPGGDGLTLDICLRAYRCNKALLVGLFSQCLRLGCFPRSWKVATIKVIPKPGRDSYTTPKSYRPIGLLPVFGKMLEKLFVNRLQWQLGRESSLSPFQYGFTPQRSAEDALFDAMSIVRASLEQKKMVVLVSLDIEGAFDNAWWPAIVEQLRASNVDAEVARLILSYLSERSIKLKYAGQVVCRDTNKGCIQGSTCGPILWNIQLEPVLEQAQYGGVRVQAFADDILLIAAAADGVELEGMVNRALAVITQWGESLKLRFAPEKTQALLITKKLRYHSPRLVMVGVPIAFGSSLRILGLNIDSILNFRRHLELVTNKAIAFYKVVSRAARAQWGLNSDILRLIYIAVVEPTVLYSASCWADVSDRVYAEKTLNSLIRSFAIKISKAHRTVSLVSSVLLSGLLPLTIRLKENALIYRAKRGEPMAELPGRSMEHRKSPFSLPHPAERKHLRFGLIESPEEASSLGNDGLVLYTDGSKLEGRVGGAVTCWSDRCEVRHTRFRLENYCSVFQAELCAILRALQLAEGRGESAFSIASDSRSSLEAVSDPNSLHPLVAEIKELIVRLGQEGKAVTLYWVKAHCGIEGNERADELAKQAALRDRRQPFYDKYPLSYAKRLVRSDSINDWQKVYDTSQAGSTTKLFFKNVTLAYQTLRKISLDNFYAQIFTGHGGFNSYLFRFKLTDSPLCSCGEDVSQSVQHLLLECARFGLLRHDCECAMDFDISVDTLEQLIRDNILRPIFLSFAKTILRIIGKENGSFVEVE